MTQTPATKPAGTVRIVLGVIALVIALFYLVRALGGTGGDGATEAGTVAGLLVFAIVGVVLLLTGTRARRH